MAVATRLKAPASCVTGRGSNQVNFYLLEGQGLISSAILCLLGIPSKRGGNIPIIAFCACHALHSHHLSRPQSVGFSGATPL